MGFPIMVPNYLGILCSILLSYADTLAFYTESSLYRQGAEARGREGRAGKYAPAWPAVTRAGKPRVTVKRR